MTPIYHITHIDNMPRILSEGGLVCDAEAERRGLCKQSIAYDDIKERRKRRTVETLAGQPVAAGGVLADYVPFYFSNRSPMLGAIHKGRVPGYQGGQRDVVYLVAQAESVATAGLVWCFTNGHGVEAVSEFYARLEDLNRVDWDAVRTWRWGGRWLLDDPDIMRRKQAEFLAHQSFPWTLVERIGVLDAAMAAQVREVLASAAHQPRVTIEPKWYYDT
jgi:ssDNA thymidine ADP-ribosyltransferase, DarT